MSLCSVLSNEVNLVIGVAQTSFFDLTVATGRTLRTKLVLPSSN